MKTGIGKLIAQLAEPNEQMPKALISRINTIVNPSETVRAEDVHPRQPYRVGRRTS
ncbi:MAG: hypothetical protein SGI97_07735 [candidate division Zixibacteria bacterium]|nr:hypothetical protein [candidate division Zixibacteria bacterium]